MGLLDKAYEQSKINILEAGKVSAFAVTAPFALLFVIRYFSFVIFFVRSLPS